MKMSSKKTIIRYAIPFMLLIFAASILAKNKAFWYTQVTLDKESIVRDKNFEEQIKFDVDNKKVLDDISNARKILNYKMKAVGEYNYEDYYYDTPDYDLFKLGYSYRLRIADKGDNLIEYRLQFKKEYTENPNEEDNFVRTEIDIALSEDLAKKIWSGNFGLIFSGEVEIKAVKEVNSFLKSKNIELKSISPLIYCRQHRDRFLLKEGKTNYYCISLDNVYFERVQEKEKNIRFYQLEVENKFGGGYFNGQPRIVEERNQKIVHYLAKKYGIKMVRDSKYKKAVSAFKN